MSKVHLSDILDVDLLKAHITGGLVSARPHPSLPLVIYNYTPAAQFGNVWGDGTIDFCRGLIADEDGQVVARPFRKFHNLNTSFVPETMEANLPNVRPNVTEKMDGSLGIFWRYGAAWGVATRGSFTSPQAQWATAWYQHMLAIGQASLFEYYNTTPLFEIIYPENRVVCKYDFSGLVLLAMIDIATGAEYPRIVLEAYGGTRGFVDERIVADYGSKNLATVLSENETNREGYVLTFNTSDSEPPLKVKVKFDDYVRLHKVVTGMSPIAIWEILASGKSPEWLADLSLPDHFRSWATQWVDRLYEEFATIHRITMDIFNARPLRYFYKQDRKEMAEYFKTAVMPIDQGDRYLGILFAMLDCKPKGQIEQAIWRMIKPRGDDQSFRKDGE